MSTYNKLKPVYIGGTTNTISTSVGSVSLRVDGTNPNPNPSPKPNSYLNGNVNITGLSSDLSTAISTISSNITSLSTRITTDESKILGTNYELDYDSYGSTITTTVNSNNRIKFTNTGAVGFENN
jgi:hypothetical protein